MTSVPRFACLIVFFPEPEEQGWGCTLPVPATGGADKPGCECTLPIPGKGGADEPGCGCTLPVPAVGGVANPGCGCTLPIPAPDDPGAIATFCPPGRTRVTHFGHLPEALAAWPAAVVEPAHGLGAGPTGRVGLQRFGPGVIPLPVRG